MKKFLILVAVALCLITPLVVKSKSSYISTHTHPETVEAKSLTISEMIQKHAKEYGYSKEGVLLTEVMPKICKAEGECKNVPNWKYTDENGYYTAFGIFQITRSTYRQYCGPNTIERKDPEKNIICAMKIAKYSGLFHWDESAHAW